VWLLFVYLWMSSNCEGFVQFVLLMVGGALLSISALVLAIMRSIPFRRLILCALAMALTLPASMVVQAVEHHFAAENLKTISDALKRYRSDHGRYPHRLSALTPRYLTRVPSAILHFQVRQAGYVRSSPHVFSLHYQLVCGPEVKSEARTCAAWCRCWDAPIGALLSGASNVPRNARLLFEWPDDLAGSAALRAEDGSEVGVEVEASGIGGLRWIRPRTLLAAGERYALQVRADEDADSFEVVFQVGNEVDDAPPEVRGTRIEPLASSASCDLGAGAELRVGSLADPDHPGELVYAQLTVTVGEDRQNIVIPLNAHAQLQEEPFGNTRTGVPEMCLGHRLVPAAVPGARASATVTYYDLGGNAVTTPSIQFAFGDTAPPSCPVTE